MTWAPCCPHLNCWEVCVTPQVFDVAHEGNYNWKWRFYCSAGKVLSTALDACSFSQGRLQTRIAAGCWTHLQWLVKWVKCVILGLTCKGLHTVSCSHNRLSFDVEESCNPETGPLGVLSVLLEGKWCALIFCCLPHSA